MAEFRQRFPGLYYLLERIEDFSSVAGPSLDEAVLSARIEAHVGALARLDEETDSALFAERTADTLGAAYLRGLTHGAPLDEAIDADFLEDAIRTAVALDLSEPRDREWLEEAIRYSRTLYEFRKTIERVGSALKRAGSKAASWVKDVARRTTDVVRRTFGKPEKEVEPPVKGPQLPPPEEPKVSKEEPKEAPKPEAPPVKGPQLPPEEPKEEPEPEEVPEEEPEEDPEAAVEHMIYHWVRTFIESCPDCIKIQEHSPYTKATLPTYPRAGHTICREHCHCYLKQERVSAAKYEEIERKTGGAALVRLMADLLGIQYSDRSWVGIARRAAKKGLRQIGKRLLPKKPRAQRKPLFPGRTPPSPFNR